MFKVSSSDSARERLWSIQCRIRRPPSAPESPQQRTRSELDAAAGSGEKILGVQSLLTGEDFGSASLMEGDRNRELQRVASIGQAAIHILVLNSFCQWLDPPSLDSTFCISRAIAILIRDTPKKVSYDMTKLNEFDEFRLFLCARCYVTSLSMVSHINNFLLTEKFLLV